MFEAIKNYFIITWEEIKEWIYNNNSSLASYFAKLFIGMMIYIIIADYVKKAVEKLQGKLNKKASDYWLGFFALGIFQLIIDSVLVCIIIRQLNIVEVDPLATIAVSGGVVIILTLQGVLTKQIKKIIHFFVFLARGEDVKLPNSKEIHLPKVERYSPSGKFLHFLFKLIGEFVGAAIAILIVLLSYRGINSLLGSGGVEIATIAKLPEYRITAETGKRFEWDDDLIDDIPVFSDGYVKVKTNGDLNLIYFNEHKVGVNIDTKKYKIYGVSINQAEVSIQKKMTYKYSGEMEIIGGMYGNKYDLTLYYNTQNNDGLIIMSNGKNNRVSSVTYYHDLKTISQKLDIY